MPQGGKPLSFHYWLTMNKHRYGWNHLDEEKIVIACRDGDSGSSDGGMMMLMKPAVIGNFMINTPGEPNRIKSFHAMVNKYSIMPGTFFTLDQEVSPLGRWP